MADQLNQIQTLATQFDLALRNPGDIEQIIYEAGHLPKLPFQNLDIPRHLWVVDAALTDEIQSVVDGSERVAQFMRQHRQKLVLAPVHFQESVCPILELCLQALAVR